MSSWLKVSALLLGQRTGQVLEGTVHDTDSLSCVKAALQQIINLHRKVKIFRGAKTSLVYACLMLCLLIIMCLCQFSRCPCRGMQKKFLLDGSLALFCLSLKNLIYCPLAICNSQFAALFRCHSTVVDFFFLRLLPPPPVRPTASLWLAQ